MTRVNSIDYKLYYIYTLAVQQMFLFTTKQFLFTVKYFGFKLDFLRL